MTNGVIAGISEVVPEGDNRHRRQVNVNLKAL